jgi:hypothetical protein
MLLPLLLCLWVLSFGCNCAFGQQPMISNIQITDLDTSSFRIFFNVSGTQGAWTEVFYGTQSGTYPYNTKSIQCYNTTSPCQTTSGITSHTITGLKPGTTYYVRVTARPNPDDDTNICNTPACGSTELTVTTINGPQPSPPQVPASWAPSPPDTTGYAVIPLQAGSTGECQAAQTVSTDQWTVSAGTYLQAAMLTVGYGTVFELPQGLACKVPAGVNNFANGGAGYVLPAKDPDNNCNGACSLDDPRHRWIMFRTQTASSADFPPFGSRITPDFAPLLGKFYSSQPNQFSQLFDADFGTGAVHHYWFQNVEFLDDPAYRNPADAVDPIGFSFFARLGSSFQTQNNQFLVFDRVYAHGPGAPIRHIQAYELGGNNIAMIGCYTSQIEAWRMTMWPSKAGSTSSGGAALQIPQNLFRFANSSPTLGMPGPATAVLRRVTGAGVAIGNLYKDHLEIQYSTSIGGDIQCTLCTATAVAAPATPPTAIQLFSGTITAAGQFAGLNWNVFEYQTTRYLMAFGIQTSDLKAPGGPYYFENNYIDGVGEGFYMDPVYSVFSSDDLTYTHNHHIWPKTYFVSDPGNQWRYEVRQHWETKRLHRAILRGNLFSYSWSFQNDGPAIFLSGRPTYVIHPGNDGLSDIKIESNIISHGRSGIDCSSGNSIDNNGVATEPAAAKRVQITNNLMFDLGRWKYCDTAVGCPGLGSFYFSNYPGCQDLVIENNTAGPSYGDIPSFFFLGGGQMLSNYLSFQRNVLYLSKGLGGGGAAFGDWPANTVRNHDVRPAPVYDNNSSPSPNFKTNLDATFVNAADSVTPSYTWKQNVIIGGWKDTNQTLAGAVDLTSSELQAYAAKMPSGDSYPPGNTISQREQQLNLINTSGFNFQISLPSSYSPGNRGVDYNKLYSDQGLVTGIQPPQLSGTTAVFQYTAPDSRGCVVDVGQAGSWIRTADQGGGQQRLVEVDNLQQNTTYNYRIICYYKQVNDGVLYTDFLADQITDGTFSLARPRRVRASIPFSLSTVASAAQVTVTLTPQTGLPITATCSISPCTLMVDSGDYTLTLQYRNAAGDLLLASGIGKRKIQ